MKAASMSEAARPRGATSPISNIRRSAAKTDVSRSKLASLARPPSTSWAAASAPGMRSISRSPACRTLPNGFLAFKDVKVDTDRDGFYIRHVRIATTNTLSKEFKYSLASDAKRLMEQQDPAEPYKRKLLRFDVSAIPGVG